jgi:pimeloyl-ACP methyl ester carboxylesterase
MNVIAANVYLFLLQEFSMVFRCFIIVFFAAIFSQVCQGEIPSDLPENSAINPSAPVSHLEIYVNGAWSSDIDSYYDSAKPSVVLIHGWRPDNIDSSGKIIVSTLDDYWLSATTALSKRVNRNGIEGNINLLGWNWITEASTSKKPLPVVVPVQYVFSEGFLLAKKLQALQSKKRFHIIGHSLGAKVAAVMAVQASSLPIDQVTLFDGPELDTSNSLLGSLIDTTPVYLYDNIKTLLSRGLFVDSYSSAFGSSYQEKGLRCADINMKPPFSVIGLVDTAVLAHHYPINWYFGGNSGTLGSPAGTIDSNTGDIDQPVGAAWSKVLNRVDLEKIIEANRTTYTLGTDANSPMAGLQYELASRIDPYDLIAVASVRADRETTTTDIPLTGGSYSWETSGDVGIVKSGGMTEAIMTASDHIAILSTTVSVPEGNAWIRFSFKSSSPEPTDKLTVFIGSTLLWSFSGIAYPDSEDFIETDPIDLSSQAGQTVTLNFCYGSKTAGKSAEIADIELFSQQKKNTYHLKTQTDEEGSVYPQDRLFEDGTVVTLRAIPQEDYHVHAWRNTDDNKSTADTNTVTMTDNTKIKVYFANENSPNCPFTGLYLFVLIGMSFLLVTQWPFRD